MDGSTGAKTKLGLFPMSLYAGSIYGLLLFLVVFWAMYIRAIRSPAPSSNKAAARVQADPELQQLLRRERAEQAKKKQKAG